MSKKIRVKKPKGIRSLIIEGMILHCKGGPHKNRQDKRNRKDDWKKDEDLQSS